MGVRRDDVVGRELQIGDEDSFLGRIADQENAFGALRQDRLVLPGKRVRLEGVHRVDAHAIDLLIGFRMRGACDGEQDRGCQKPPHHVLFLLQVGRT
jgi:hypothetical protein